MAPEPNPERNSEMPAAPKIPGSHTPQPAGRVQPGPVLPSGPDLGRSPAAADAGRRVGPPGLPAVAEDAAGRRRPTQVEAAPSRGPTPRHLGKAPISGAPSAPSHGLVRPFRFIRRFSVPQPRGRTRPPAATPVGGPRLRASGPLPFGPGRGWGRGRAGRGWGAGRGRPRPPICRTKAAEAAEMRWRRAIGCKQPNTKLRKEERIWRCRKWSLGFGTCFFSSSASSFVHFPSSFRVTRLCSPHFRARRLAAPYFSDG